MIADVVDLRDFYATRPGRAARAAIRGRLREIWPDLSGQRVAGIGYAVPYLRAWSGEAERVLALMPAGQGVLRWPPGEPNRAALIDEAALPLPDNALDRVLLVHALEHAEQLRPMLREVWRVLSGSGRALFVVPNRRGIWAHVDSTPFGHGQPYSAGQLTRLLRDNLFTPTVTAGALFGLPFGPRLLPGSAKAWERIGRRAFERFAGVVIVEATKSLYMPDALRQRRRLLAPRPALAAGWRVNRGA